MPKSVRAVYDAWFDLVVFVHLDDVMEARRKTKESCGPEERRWGCAIEISGLRQHPEFRAIRVDGTTARVQFRDETKPDWRWILEKDGKRIADLNDMNMEALLQLEWPLPVRLISAIAHVPGEDETSHKKRYTRSLEWGRSEEGKQAKRESAARREGMERGPYDAPTGKWRDGRSMTGFYTRDDE